MIRQKANARVSDAFLDLVKAFPLRPIRSERDHEAAIEVIRRLVGSKPEDQFTPDERDYLEALTILTHDYQQKRRHAELGPLGPGELVRHLMDENGMNVTDLGRVIGSRTAASMIVNGRRSPSKDHVLRLAERFGVDPSLFLAGRSGSTRRKTTQKAI